MKTTGIGRGTALIEEKNIRLPTDPYLGAHGNLTYKRVCPALAVGCRPTAVEAVLMSNVRWDHADPDFLRSLPTPTPILNARFVQVREREACTCENGFTQVPGLYRRGGSGESALLEGVGQVRWTIPPEGCGGHDKAVEAKENGLKPVRERKSPVGGLLIPSRGEPGL